MFKWQVWLYFDHFPAFQFLETSGEPHIVKRNIFPRELNDAKCITIETDTKLQMSCQFVCSLFATNKIVQYKKNKDLSM